MAWKSQGIGHDDVREGFDIVAACKTSDELRIAIEQHPLLRSSVFHEFLRYSVAHARSEGRTDPLTYWYDEFFLLQHRRVHSECLQQGLNQPIGTTVASTSLAPEYFRKLIAACTGRIPDSVAAPRQPDRDRQQIEGDLIAMNVDSALLPPYEAIPAIRWSVLVVDCPRCQEASLVAHAHFVDLIAAPHLKDALCTDRINAHRCPRCAHIGFAPRFVWIQEPPGASDELNGAAAIVLLDPSTTIYQAPPGTLEHNNNDVVILERFNQLCQQMSICEFEPNRQERSLSIVIIYSQSELVRFLQERDEPDAMPSEMLALVSMIARGLTSGALAPSVAEQKATNSIAGANNIKDWPIPLAGSSFSPDPYEHLAHSVVAEAVARARHEDIGLQAILATQTSHAFHAIGEIGLFEQALARAEDTLEQLPPGSERSLLETDLAESRAALAVKHGDHSQAAAIRRDQIEKLAASDSFTLRAYRAQIRASLGLNLLRSQKIADSFTTFQEATETLEKLIEEAKSSTDEREREHIERLTNSLSGALANWSTLLDEMAEVLDVIQFCNHEQNAHGAELPQHRAAALARGHRAMEQGWQAELEPTLSILSKYWATCIVEDRNLHPSPEWTFADCVALTKILARRMLERALGLSTAVHGWNFAGRQAKRLAMMQDDAGEHEAAEQTMRNAIEYATRVRDRQTLADGYVFLGNRDGKAGDGAAALAYMRDAARESMRATISRGIHTRESSTHRALLWMAIQCARFNGATADAIAITESLKGVAMSVSLERGQVFTGDPEDATRRGVIASLREKYERLRFHATLNPHDLQVLRELEQNKENLEVARNEAILRDPRYARWCDANALDVCVGQDLHRRLNALGPRAAYLGFFRFGDVVWTYLCRDDNAFVPRIQNWPFANDGDPRVCSRPVRLDETKIQQWSTLLLAPLSEQLKELRPDDPLVVSVDDELMDVPIAALYLGGKRLCERATVSIVHGLGMLEKCIDRKTLYNSVLCIGDPLRFDTDRLPASIQEVDAISHQFRSSGGSARALLAEHATIRALREASATVDVLHFACHARGSGVTPSDNGPRLLLAIDESGYDSGHLSDERILSEIALKEGAMVNLAACSSDERRGGQGPIARGLVPAFLVKGASAVLSNQWALDDDTASQFNSMFYSLLLSGLRPAAALAATQRACIAGDLGEEMADPAAWAGYRLWGAR